MQINVCNYFSGNTFINKSKMCLQVYFEWVEHHKRSLFLALTQCSKIVISAQHSLTCIPGARVRLVLCLSQ